MMTIRLRTAASLVMLTSVIISFEGHAADSSKAPRIARPVAGTALESSAQRDDALRLELASAVSRLNLVESAILKSADRADQVAHRTSLYSLFTVLGTALLTALLSLVAQGLLMRHQRKINDADSEAQVANSYVEWQLQQLSELYGPVRALLGQSNVLYRQMNKALVSADESRFRLVPCKDRDFDGQEFQINLEGNWTRFRTVKHLAEVYNKGYGVEPYFDDVVDVGSRLAIVIREKAGFAQQDDSDLVQVMGEYLAHYLVLKRLHERAKMGVALHLNKADEQAVFPNRIQELVDNGFNSINKQVIKWRGPKTTKT